MVVLGEAHAVLEDGRARCEGAEEARQDTHEEGEAVHALLQDNPAHDEQLYPGGAALRFRGVEGRGRDEGEDAPGEDHDRVGVQHFRHDGDGNKDQEEFDDSFH